MQPVDISIVIPTYNERGNLAELVRRIGAALSSVNWEVIFVDDDSPDGTAAQARTLYHDEPRVRCIRRLGRRGLSSACIEGMLSSSARFVAVMDADLQHDPALLRPMYDLLDANQADLVLGTRYADGGSVGEWDGKRLAMSQTATRMAALVTKRPVSDPMSGFFALTRQAFEDCVGRLSNLGFKILLDIIASSKDTVRIKEVPFTFGKRLTGESKLSTNVAWEFLLMLLDKMIGKYIPVRFVAFGAIGLLGVAVHFAVLSFAFKVLGISFAVSQALATAVAIMFNFSVNNLLTYAGSTLRGVKWLKGLAIFYVICGVGAAANVGVASYLFGNQFSWALAAVAGIALSSVWNYALSSRYTWGASK